MKGSDRSPRADPMLVSALRRLDICFAEDGLGIVRRITLWALLIAASFSLLSLPELLSDERANRQFYRTSVGALVDAWAKVPESERSKANHAEFMSPRMWDYKDLVLAAHCLRGANDGDRATAYESLLKWQTWRANHGSEMWRHYLWNPGFFWDICLLLPISIAALVMGLASLVHHFDFYQSPAAEEKALTISSRQRLEFWRMCTHPLTILICLVGGLVMTAGNHGSAMGSGTVQRTAYQIAFIATFLAPLPYLYVLCDGLAELRLVLTESKPWRLLDWRGHRSASSIRVVMIGATATVLVTSAIAVATSLSDPAGWKETITGAQLSLFKPVQRIIKGSLYAYGLLVGCWTIAFVVWKANSAKLPSSGSIDDDDQLLTSLARREIRFLEYFGVFVTIVLASYAQEAVFLWRKVDRLGTLVGLFVLAGIIVLVSLLFIVPILYAWYVRVDVKRYDRWAVLTRASGTLSQVEREKLSDLQQDRVTKTLKNLLMGPRVLAPILTMILILLLGSGLFGVLGKVLNALPWLKGPF